MRPNFTYPHTPPSTPTGSTTPRSLMASLCASVGLTEKLRSTPLRHKDLWILVAQLPSMYWFIKPPYENATELGSG